MMVYLKQAFEVDVLSKLMMALIIFIIITVSAFSRRYMAGDRYHHRHAGDVFVLCACVLAMVCADDLLVFLVAWGASNLYLVRLMVHKKEWAAAYKSGMLALKTFALGFVMLAAGFLLLADVTGTASIHTMLAMNLPSSKLFLPLLLIVMAAMTQSGIWPFHKWLTSSLNSPTPVSALMHAGLVNGGGFLLVRFASLYLTQPVLLKVIFIAGLLTAVMGTFWKLMQTDIKRMLACSTMGQMGFMIAQCGMGLFPLAVSHLVWHGLFKAYLFLATGSVVQEKRRKDPFGDITLIRFVLASMIGLAGTYAFALVTGNIFSLSDTSGIMLGIAFMTCVQMACNRLVEQKSLVMAFAVSVVSGFTYGVSLRMIEITLAPLSLFKPQPMDAIYAGGFAVIFMVWLAMNMNIAVRLQQRAWWKRLYMTALNASQPHPETITSTRNAYQF